MLALAWLMRRKSRNLFESLGVCLCALEAGPVIVLLLVDDLNRVAEMVLVVAVASAPVLYLGAIAFLMFRVLENNSAPLWEPRTLADPSKGTVRSGVSAAGGKAQQTTPEVSTVG